MSNEAQVIQELRRVVRNQQDMTAARYNHRMEI